VAGLEKALKPPEAAPPPNKFVCCCGCCCCPKPELKELAPEFPNSDLVSNKNIKEIAKPASCKMTCAHNKKISKSTLAFETTGKFVIVNIYCRPGA